MELPNLHSKAHEDCMINCRNDIVTAARLAATWQNGATLPSRPFSEVSLPDAL